MTRGRGRGRRAIPAHLRAADPDPLPPSVDEDARNQPGPVRLWRLAEADLEVVDEHGHIRRRFPEKRARPERELDVAVLHGLDEAFGRVDVQRIDPDAV